MDIHTSLHIDTNTHKSTLTHSKEFFFHAMGGREGLIDTAVKTSSTGAYGSVCMGGSAPCAVLCWVPSSPQTAQGGSDWHGRQDIV